MQYYDDKQNKNAVEVIFFIFQIGMFLIVHGFVYTSFVAVKLAVQKFDLTFMAYFPVVLVSVLYAGVLYGTRKMFRSQKRIHAVAWMMGWACVGIAGLYFYLSQLMGV